MPSPFPGMNPYLEQSYDWEDFHNEFISKVREALSDEVGPNYFVKLEVRLLLHERSAAERRFVGKADVGITTARIVDPSARIAGASTAPMQLQLPAVEIIKQTYVEIRDSRNRRLVTVIELLSPSNKVSGDDRNSYLGKRDEILARQTHLVEIDLRRGGKRPTTPMAIPPCDYYALVSRYEDRPNVDFWPIGLRDPLPTIPVPLSEPDAPVPLDLKAMLDRAYDAAHFGKHIYSEQPDPPLRPEDDAWARGIAGLPIHSPT